MIMLIKHLDTGRVKKILPNEVSILYYAKCAYCERKIMLDERQYHEFALNHGYHHDLWFCNSKCAEKSNIKIERTTQSGRMNVKFSLYEVGGFLVLIEEAN